MPAGRVEGTRPEAVPGEGQEEELETLWERLRGTRLGKLPAGNRLHSRLQKKEGLLNIVYGLREKKVEKMRKRQTLEARW